MLVERKNKQRKTKRDDRRNDFDRDERTRMNDEEQMIDEIIEIVPEGDDVRNDEDQDEENSRNEIEFLHHRRRLRSSHARAGHRHDRTVSIVGKCNDCVHHHFAFVCLSVGNATIRIERTRKEEREEKFSTARFVSSRQMSIDASSL